MIILLLLSSLLMCGEAVITTQPAGQCGDTMVAHTHTLQKLMTPGNPYSNNEDCSWTIEAAADKKVQITVWGRTESCCDFLTVIDFNSTYRNNRARISGLHSGSSPVVIVSDLNSVKLHFTSDYSITDVGYVISYQAVDGVNYSTSHGDHSTIRNRLFPPGNHSTTTTTHQPEFRRFTTRSWQYPTGNNPTTQQPSFRNVTAQNWHNSTGNPFPLRELTTFSSHNNSSMSSRSNVSSTYDSYSNWTQAISTNFTCGYDSTLTSSWQKISTPGWPDRYPDNSRCQWKFAVPENATVEIVFKEGHTEEIYDYLEMKQYNEGLEEQKSLLRWSGSIRSGQKYSFDATAGYIILNFFSDISISKRGYTAFVKTASRHVQPQNETLWNIPKTSVYGSAVNCGFNTTLTSNWKNISSPDWPFHYPDGTICLWTFKVYEQTTVEFVIHRGQTEFQHDFIEIVQMNEDFEVVNYLAKRDGYLTEPEIPMLHISPGFFGVYFVADQSITDHGFTGAVRSNPNQFSIQTQTTPVHHPRATTTSGNIFLTQTQRAPVQHPRTTSMNRPYIPPYPDLEPADFFQNRTSSVPCGYDSTLSHHAQVIYTPRSPYFPPDYYPNDARCEWKFRVFEPTTVQIVYSQGSTQPQVDYFQIVHFDEEMRLSSRNLLGGHSGQLYDEHTSLISVSEGYLVVYFVSDGSIRYRGLNISLQAVTGNTFSTQTQTAPLHQEPRNTTTFFQRNTSSSVSCGYNSTLSHHAQVISTPNWPHNYLDGARCEWKFRVFEPTLVEISYSEGATELCCDYIEVVEFDEEMSLSSRNPLDRIAGERYSFHKNVVSVSEGYLVVYFVSDGSVTKQGYHISLQAVSAQTTYSYQDSSTPSYHTTLSYNSEEPAELKPDVSCGETSTLTYQWQKISTPNWPNGYPNRAICEWTFRVLEPSVVELYIEGEIESDYDYLWISNSYGSNTTSQLVHIDSITGNKKYSPGNYDYSVKKGNFVMKFISDESVTREGYFAVVRLQAENYTSSHHLYGNRTFAPTANPLSAQPTSSYQNSTSYSQSGSSYPYLYNSTYPYNQNISSTNISCGYNSTLTTEWQDVFTPNWPHSGYPNGAYCKWFFYVPESSMLNVYLREGEIEWNYDYLRISTLPEESGYYDPELLNKTGPIYTPQRLNFTVGSGYLVITFKSDSIVSGRGYSLSVRSGLDNNWYQYTTPYPSYLQNSSYPSNQNNSSTNTGCGYNSTLTTDWQDIFTPNWPLYNYSNGANCQWKFFVRDESKLEIRFNEGDTEVGYDFLRITTYRENMPPDHYYTLLTKSGPINTTERFNFTIQPGSYLLIKFTSDRSVNSRGYSLSIRNDPAQFPPQPKVQCLVGPEWNVSKWSNSIFATFLPTSSNDRRIETCHPSKTDQPACGEVRYNYNHFGVESYVTYGMCTVNTTDCHNFDCAKTMMLSDFFQLGDVFECKVSCYSNITTKDSASIRVFTSANSSLSATTEDYDNNSYQYTTPYPSYLQSSSYPSNQNNSSTETITFSGSKSIGRLASYQGLVKSVTVTFPERLPSVPTIEARTVGEEIHPDTFATSIRYPSQVGFTAEVRRTDAHLGWGQNPTLHWTVSYAGTAVQTETTVATTDVFGILGSVEDDSNGYSARPRLTPQGQAPSSCDVTFEANVQKQYFTSPGYYGDGYTNDMHCTYRFNAPEGNQIKLIFIEGELERCCDKIEIESTLSTGYGNLVEGSFRNITRLSRYNSLTFVMRSDSSVTKKGFYASYEAVPAEITCGSTIKALEQSKSVNTPGYPHAYVNNEDCFWRIKAPEGQRVEITLVAGGSTESCCDHLVVSEWHLENQISIDLASFSGYATGLQRVISNYNSVKVRFTSDSSVTDAGYRFNYRAVNDTATLPNIHSFTNFHSFSNFTTTTEMPSLYNSSSPTWNYGTTSESYNSNSEVMEWISRNYACGYNSTLTKNWQNVSTPNWPNNYPANTRCRWKFYIPENTRLEISLQDGDTESCCDYVEVSHYDEALQRRTFMGRKDGSVREEEIFHFPVRRGYVVIDFFSDHSVNSRGYTASIKAGNGTFDGDFFGNSSYPLYPNNRNFGGDLSGNSSYPPYPDNRNFGGDLSGNSSYPPYPGMYGNATVDHHTPPRTPSRPSSVEVKVTQIALFSGCTLEQFLDDLVICASLFVNDYPYQNTRTCRTNFKMVVKCIEKKIAPCYTGSLPSSLDVFSSLSEERLRQREGSALHSFSRRLSYEIRTFCDEEIKLRVAERLSDIRSRDWIFRHFFNSRNEKTLIESYDVMADIIKAKTSEEFCRLYDAAIAILPRINWADIWMGLEINFPPSIRFPPVFAPGLGPNMERILSNLQLPKCLAYQAIAESSSGCLQKEFDIMFVVQGSGYDNSTTSFNQTLRYIEQIVAPLATGDHRIGLVLYSKYVKNKSMKNQPFIETEIPSQYFDNDDDFKAVLDSIEPHDMDGEEAYAGRALKKALTMSLNATASRRVNENCTQKIVFMLMKNRTSDVAALRNLIPRIKRENVYVFAIIMNDGYNYRDYFGYPWRPQRRHNLTELHDIITEDVGQVIFTDGYPEYTMDGIWEQMRRLRGESLYN